MSRRLDYSCTPRTAVRIQSAGFVVRENAPKKNFETEYIIFTRD